MIYEIGIHYTGDTVYDQQVKIPNIPIDKNQRRFWFGSDIIPHWNEDENNTWVKVPVLYNGLNKIYVDDSQIKDLSNIDETMIFGDDFNGTSLDITKWIPNYGGGGASYSIHDGMLDVISNNSGGGSGCFLTANNNNLPFDNYVIEYKGKRMQAYNGGEVGVGGGITPDPTNIDITNYGLPRYRASSHLYMYTTSSKNRRLIDYYANSTDVVTPYLTASSTEDFFGLWINVKNVFLYSQMKNISYFTYPDGTTYSITATGTVTMDGIYPYVGYGDYDQTNAHGYIDYYFIHKYLPTDPVITYIKPYQRMFHIKNTIFNQSNNILSYNPQYIETPVIELDNNIQKVNISTINNKTFYYRGSNTQPDITQTGTTSSNTKYWDQNTISNSGWNNTIPSEYVEYKGLTNYKYIQYKIPTSY